VSPVETDLSRIKRTSVDGLAYSPGRRRR